VNKSHNNKCQSTQFDLVREMRLHRVDSKIMCVVGSIDLKEIVFLSLFVVFF